MLLLRMAPSYDTQIILVSRINYLLISHNFIGFVDDKNIEYYALSF